MGQIFWATEPAENNNIISVVIPFKTNKGKWTTSSFQQMVQWLTSLLSFPSVERETSVERRIPGLLPSPAFGAASADHPQEPLVAAEVVVGEQQQGLGIR